MKNLRSLIYILAYLCCMLLFITPSFADQLATLTRSPGRALLSLDQPNVNTSLVATQDGAIHLVETKTKNVLWSFHSGPPIYSSYQAPIHQDDSADPSNGFFIDIGDDWNLYIHAKFHGKIKLHLSIEDFIRSTPHISEDGSVLLGSKKATVYEVEASTGKLIHVYNLSDTPSMFNSNEDKSVLNTTSSMEADFITTDIASPRLHITRTDYSLQSFAPNSNKVSWNITIAEIGVVLICQDDKKFLSGPPLIFKYDAVSDYGNDFSMPLQCQSRAVVYRYRDRNMLGSSSGPSRLPLASEETPMLLTPALSETLPLQNEFDESSDIDDARKMLPKKTAKSLLQLQSEFHSDVAHPRSQRETQNAKIIIASLMSYKWSARFSIILFVSIVVTYLINQYARASKRQNDLNGHLSNHNSKSSPSKKKKYRKSGKNSSNADDKENHDASRLEDGHTDNAMWLDLNKHIYGSVDGRQIGKLFVLDSEIAKGSNGTIIFEGIYEGRPVAVKRLVRAHHDVAIKEIQHLIASDKHPNIVRWYGVEYDKDFVYLSLERCACSLDDLIRFHSDFTQRQVVPVEQAVHTIKLDSVKKTLGDLHLWKVNGYPSLQLIKLMRDVVSGLVHLHDLGIIHRDLKPQNVLIIKDTSLCAKLSDMGISKQLAGDMSSLGQHVTGCGSSGWQAPEQLLHGRQTRAVDMFSLGCVLFYCITGGRHPYGSHYERDANIVRNRIDLFLVKHIPEAKDLFIQLLNPDPVMRPKATEVLHHPFFWSYEMRLSFLRDVSDRVELEGRESDSLLLKALEGTAPEALGGKWEEKLELSFISNIGYYRRYKYDSVRDLLRVMRNKLNHYRELPKEIQELLGSIPDGFYEYFATRFPKLFIEVYKVIMIHCKEEECFYKYFNSND